MLLKNIPMTNRYSNKTTATVSIAGMLLIMQVTVVLSWGFRFTIRSGRKTRNVRKAFSIFKSMVDPVNFKTNVRTEMITTPASKTFHQLRKYASLWNKTPSEMSLIIISSRKIAVNTLSIWLSAA